MDAVDTALVDIDEKKIDLIDFQEFPIPDPIRMPLRAINDNSPLKEVAMMDVRVGELFAESVMHLLNRNKSDKANIVAIGSHGQTIFHSPNSSPPCTVQIGDPNTIAVRTGIPTVADFRRMDMANGGQGAPLAPLFHQAFFQADYPRILLNIGGIANITILTDDPEDPVTGFDTGPGNCLMDDWIYQHLEKAFDENGSWAKTGNCSSELLDVLLDEDYFNRNPPKSTGRDDFNLDWLLQKMKGLKKMITPEDVQATLVSFTVQSIKAAIENTKLEPREILVCGGGAKNHYLMEQFKEALKTTNVSTTADHGLDIDAVEACCFAWLASCRINQRALDLTQLTGSSTPVMLGAIYN